MGDHTTQADVLTIGLDIGDRHCHWCAVDAAGKQVAIGRIRTRKKDFSQDFEALEPAVVAMEVGAESHWISRLLSSWGHQVLVANPRHVRLIYGGRNKDDKLDAAALARLARLDPELLYPIHHRGEQAQADLSIIRSRDCLVRGRTRLVNHVRGLVKPFGVHLPSCSTPSFAYRCAAEIPEPLRPALEPVVAEIGALTKAIRALERQLEEIADIRYPETEQLRQVTGVGVITSLAYILTIEDPHRFRRSREVGPYLGLTPRRHASGEKDPPLRISKAGDRMLRQLLVSSAQYILGPKGPDTNLRRFGERMIEHGGRHAKKRAVVAVARKLAVLLHRLWVTGEKYEPLRSKGRSAPLPA